MPKKPHIKGLKRNPPKPASKQPNLPKGDAPKRLTSSLEKKIRQEMPDTVIQWNKLPIKASVVLKQFAAEVIEELGPRELSPRGASRLKKLLRICYSIWNLVVLADEKGDDPYVTFEGYVQEQKPILDLMGQRILKHFSNHLIKRKLTQFKGPEYRIYFKDIDVFIKGDEYRLQAITARIEDLEKDPDQT